MPGACTWAYAILVAEISLWPPGDVLERALALVEAQVKNFHAMPVPLSVNWHYTRPPVHKSKFQKKSTQNGAVVLPAARQAVQLHLQVLLPHRQDILLPAADEGGNG